MMITLLTGDNSFEIGREIARIEAGFEGESEHIDGSELDLRQLPDLLMGTTLFADKRQVVIKNLSENKSVWTDLGQWLPRVSDDIDLVLIDAKPDKRTLTYKELKKVAKVIELHKWSDRDTDVAEKWLINEAGRMGVQIDRKAAQLIVRRVGLDQWQLFHALDKLSLVDIVTPEVIESVIDISPSENVFNLFDAALRGDRRLVVDMISSLQLTEDPYRLFALLSGQAFQLAAVAVAGSTDTVASDLGVHPYAISKLSHLAKKLGRPGSRKIIGAFASADDDMKLSRADPWLLIEQALLKVASI